MTRFRALLLLLVQLSVPVRGVSQEPRGPDTVVVPSGTLTLHGLLWRPAGSGPFPAILFDHGSYTTAESRSMAEPVALGPVFARHGYLFLYLLRRGVSLSATQGPSEGDLMAGAFATGGQPARNRVQMELLEGESLDEARAALALLRARPDVYSARLGVVGHSFGGSLTILLTARDSGLRAAVVFSGAGSSWGHSPALRARLRAAVATSSAPFLFIHAANDYSTAPGVELARRLEELKKPAQVQIYPAFGSTPREGHNLVSGGIEIWEADVFAFLNRYLAGATTGP
jgi:dienelactone hydrolase